jgi:hypothetical protein
MLERQVVELLADRLAPSDPIRAAAFRTLLDRVVVPPLLRGEKEAEELYSFLRRYEIAVDRAPMNPQDSRAAALLGYGISRGYIAASEIPPSLLEGAMYWSSQG